MPTNEEYKEFCLALLEHFSEITKEHMAMAEAMRTMPGLLRASREYLPQATQAVDAAFGPVRQAIESGTDFRPALEELLKLP